ncbi:MAG TPA: FtsL-like putative cell division protein [Dysgonamonadaceae bacterium]|nr:FtsL-like putative cell division protein [Dysgonamonadaceae bacterium]
MKLDRIRKSFVHVFGGSVLTEGVFVRNLRFIITLLFIMFIFISYRYSVLRKMAEVESLERQLKDAKYEALSISAELTKASRQSQIEQRIAREGLDLKVSDQPFYVIKADKQKK